MAFDEPMEELIRQDGRYPRDAYAFLHEGLAFAVKQVHGEAAEGSGQTHVTPRQLCMSLRELARRKWGLLAPVVLKRWNVRTTLDFGNMVFLLADHDYMKVTAEDSLEGFREVYDFQDAFEIHSDLELKE